MKKRGTEDRRSISRREFLRLSAVLTGGAALAACGGEPPAPVAAPTAAPTAAPAAAEPTAAPAAAEPTAAPAAAEPTTAAAAAQPTSASVPTQFKEAPMLAEMVQAGTIPPVDERMPANPLVSPVMETNGKYGGTMRRAFSGVSDRVGPSKVQAEGLTWYNSDFSVRANLAESWEVNDDATEWTFVLRKGTKWSDGSDFTSANFKWWYDNVFNNETLRPLIVAGSVGSHYSTTTDGERTLMQMEVPDEYTVKFTFAAPKPLFYMLMTRAEPFAPGDYLQQFHMDLAQDKAKLEADIRAAGLEAWDRYYEAQNNWYLNPERPTHGPWVSKNALSEQLFLMERNPYFWQVDSDGNQLPYIDKITHRLFETPDVLSLWVVNGEIDFQARHVSIGNFTLYKESEEQGDYKVFLGVSANHLAFQPNQSTKNERLREFFQTRDVRIALSLAVNRDEINDLVYSGTAVPRQYSPLTKSPQYYPKLSQAYIEFDQTRANELLDGAGYAEKDAEGFRLWKDGSGETLSFVIEGTAQAGSPDEDAVQLIVKYFGEVGVKASYKAVERSLYEEHYQANEIESAFWGGDRTLLPLAAPIIFIGTQPDRPWADAWSLWKNNPDDPNGEEPPADHYIRKIWDTWDQISIEPDEARRNELWTQILDIWAEELPMIGYLGEIPAPIIVKNGFRNYVEGFPVDDTTEDEHLLNTQTYFWEDPENHSA